MSATAGPASRSIVSSKPNSSPSTGLTQRRSCPRAQMTSPTASSSTLPVATWAKKAVDQGRNGVPSASAQLASKAPASDAPSRSARR